MSAVWGLSQSDVLLASSSPPVVTNPSDICPRRFVHLASSLCALHIATEGVRMYMKQIMCQAMWGAEMVHFYEMIKKK